MYNVYINLILVFLEPINYTLIVLYVMPGFVRFHRIPFHDVIVHERFASEQRKTSRTTKDATDHVFGGFL